MTRKHYRAVAEVLRKEYDNADMYNDAASLLCIQRVVNGLADVFAADNRNFRRDTFADACMGVDAL